MTHTPGPWRVSNHRGSSFAIQTTATDHEVASVPKQAYVDNTRREADARLIAAAPDTLEALMDAQRRLRGAGMLGGDDDLINAAIAKARGQ